MSETKKYVMTYEGIKKLEDELEYLKTVKRKEITEKIKVALGYGDLSENSEYDEAKNEQAFVEGRIIQLDFKDVRLINAYFPSGTSGDIRQTFKYHWLDEFYTWLNNLKKKHPKLILCGDYNIAHKEIDIHDPKGNKNSSGFLPEERKWMDKFFENGWTDTFREFHPEPHRYSWWSQRFPTVRLQNKGWRIDYINVTDPLKKKLKDAEIFPDVKHSDHCPVYLDIEL